MKFSIVFILVLLAVSSCDLIDRNKYNTGTFPIEPVNLGVINSEYDDYNSASPTIGSYFPLCFSSNHSSQGENFDIVYKFLQVSMDRRSGKLTVGEDTDGSWGVFSGGYSNLNNAGLKINSPYNEFGPSFIQDLKYDNMTNPLFIFLYSNNENGSQDIKYVHNLDEYSVFTSPNPITWLNSAKDDAYPCLAPDSLAMYFCSDRDGKFDIFEALLDKNQSLRRNIEDMAPKTILKEIELSSDANDKCPFVMGNLMVFTSDRAGGFGGYDLYYSKLVNGKWSTPVNFGNKINTQYDEYRPIVKSFWDFTNDFMIFSSNRPGGKGGFDLYFVGIEKQDKAANE